MILLFALLAAARAETWALRESLPVEVKNPIGFAWATSTTAAEWAVDLQQQGERVTWTARLCTIATSPSFGAQTLYPEAFLRGTPARVRSGTLAEGRFTSGPFVEVVGAEDDDGDGHPGVSVTVRHPRVGEGQVYVRQEATLTYEGAASSDRIVGLVRYAPIQELLGASTWWLGAPVRQRAAGPGSFELVRVAEAGCAAVAEVWK